MSIAGESIAEVGLRLALGTIADPFVPLAINRNTGEIESVEWIANHDWHIDETAYIGLL